MAQTMSAAHLEFDLANFLPEGGVQRGVEQPKADPAPSPLRHNPHPDRTTMGEGGQGVPADVAPADNFACPAGDERRTVRFV